MGALVMVAQGHRYITVLRFEAGSIAPRAVMPITGHALVATPANIVK